MGGRISLFYQNWVLVTRDPTILNMVRGHKINFTQVPPKNLTHSRKHSEREISVVQKLLEKKVIEPASAVGYVSNIFLVPKPNGEFRLILDLSELNKFVIYQHFKMQSMKDTLNTVRPYDLFGKADLRGAYDCVLMAVSDRRFLQFFSNGILYQFRCFPNGLSECPRLFTRLLKPILSTLYRLACRLISYLDDMLMMNQDPQKLLRQLSMAVQLFTALGFVINVEKSVFTPTHEIEFLGFIINSILMTISLPQRKILKIQNACASFLQSKTITKRELASIIGLLNSSSMAVIPGPLFIRGLQAQLISVPHLRWRAPITLSADSRQDLRWWREELGNWTSSVFQTPDPTVTIQCDASGTGWGAVVQERTAKGDWNPQQLSWDINVKELMAVLLGLQHLLPEVRDQIILILSDNISALSVIRKKGSTTSRRMTLIARQIWLEQLARGNRLVVKHVPGKQNTQADALSRGKTDPGDWRLSPLVFSQINDLRGPLTLDVFSEGWNAQTPRFISYHPHQMAVATDAFSTVWDRIGSYAFPPFPLIPKVLNYIRNHGYTTVVVTPLWPAAVWYGDLLLMSVDYPILLPVSLDLMTDRTGAPHPLLPQTKLVAWKLSGNTSLVQAFLTEQQKSSPMPNVRVPRNVITTATIDSASGVGREASLPFMHL